VEKEIDGQAAKIWGLSDSELAQISSFMEIGYQKPNASRIYLPYTLSIFK